MRVFFLHSYSRHPFDVFFFSSVCALLLISVLFFLYQVIVHRCFGCTKVYWTMAESSIHSFAIETRSIHLPHNLLIVLDFWKWSKRAIRQKNWVFALFFPSAELYIAFIKGMAYIQISEYVSWFFGCRRFGRFYTTRGVGRRHIITKHDNRARENPFISSLSIAFTTFTSSTYPRPIEKYSAEQRWKFIGSKAICTVVRLCRRYIILRVCCPKNFVLSFNLLHSS